MPCGKVELTGSEDRIINGSRRRDPLFPGPIRPTGEGDALLKQDATRRLDPMAVRFRLIDELD